ncbi:MAG TPA: sigma-70 family RNA polymerase sigma factor [Vicinamibacterales bacterium]|jgi:RNA polymerase sigma factor (TIGR02999 family)|nr:sigma-70 family RNA polymerase sigma factor [Vicinamibacterales bacterium]
METRTNLNVRILRYKNLEETFLKQDEPRDVTVLLRRWRNGSEEAGNQLMETVQRELHRLAAAYLRRERQGHTLQPTAVVNEAYLRLVPQRKVAWENRAHFFGIAASMMRRVLVDYARRHRAVKRDGLAPEPISMSGVPAPAPGVDEIDVLALHDALSELSKLNARQAVIVELKYFGGLTIDEIAEVLKMSGATVKREWATAKLWLRYRIQGG